MSIDWAQRLSTPFSHRAECSRCGQTLVRRGEAAPWQHLSVIGRHTSRPDPGSVRAADAPRASDGMDAAISGDAMRWDPRQADEEMDAWNHIFHDRRNEGRRA